MPTFAVWNSTNPKFWYSYASWINVSDLIFALSSPVFIHSINCKSLSSWVSAEIFSNVTELWNNSGGVNLSYSEIISLKLSIWVS